MPALCQEAQAINAKLEAANQQIAREREQEQERQHTLTRGPEEADKHGPTR